MRLHTTCDTISAAAASMPFTLLARNLVLSISKMRTPLLLTSINVLESLFVNHDCELVAKLTGARSKRECGVR